MASQPNLDPSRIYPHQASPAASSSHLIINDASNPTPIPSDLENEKPKPAYPPSPTPHATQLPYGTRAIDTNPTQPAFVKGDKKAALELAACVMLLSTVVGFAYYSRAHRLVIARERLDDNKSISTSSIAVVVTILGGAVAVLFKSGLVILGRWWLYERSMSNKGIKLAQLAAISKGGSPKYLLHMLPIATGYFTATFILAMLLSASLAGLLNPILTSTTRTVSTYFTHLADAGPSVLGAYQGCFLGDSDGSTDCAAFIDAPAVAEAMWVGAYGTGGYVIDELYQETRAGYPTPFGVWAAWMQVPTSELRTLNNVVRQEACVPTPVPHLTCTPDYQGEFVVQQGTGATYHGVCGNQTFGNTSYPYSYTYNLCVFDPEGGQGEVYIEGAYLAGTQTTTQPQKASFNCQVTVDEQWTNAVYTNPSSLGQGYFLMDGTCTPPAGQNATNPLASSDFSGFLSAVYYELFLGVAPSGFGIFSNAISKALVNQDMSIITNMIQGGLNAAITASGLQVYPPSLGGINATQESVHAGMVQGDVAVTYYAYSWGVGWRSILWGTVAIYLLLCSVFALYLALLGKLSPIDPQSFTDTVLLGQASHNSMAVHPGVKEKQAVRLSMEDGRWRIE